MVGVGLPDGGGRRAIVAVRDDAKEFAHVGMAAWNRVAEDEDLVGLDGVEPREVRLPDGVQLGDVAMALPEEIQKGDAGGVVGRLAEDVEHEAVFERPVAAGVGVDEERGAVAAVPVEFVVDIVAENPRIVAETRAELPGLGIAMLLPARMEHVRKTVDGDRRKIGVGDETLPEVHDHRHGDAVQKRLRPAGRHRVGHHAGRVEAPFPQPGAGRLRPFLIRAVLRENIAVVGRISERGAEVAAVLHLLDADRIVGMPVWIDEPVDAVHLGHAEKSGRPVHEFPAHRRRRVGARLVGGEVLLRTNLREGRARLGPGDRERHIVERAVEALVPENRRPLPDRLHTFLEAVETMEDDLTLRPEHRAFDQLRGHFQAHLVLRGLGPLGKTPTFDDLQLRALAVLRLPVVAGQHLAELDHVLGARMLPGLFGEAKQPVFVRRLGNGDPGLLPRAPQRLRDHYVGLDANGRADGRAIDGGMHASAVRAAHGLALGLPISAGRIPRRHQRALVRRLVEIVAKRVVRTGVGDARRRDRLAQVEDFLGRRHRAVHDDRHIVEARVERLVPQHRHAGANRLDVILEAVAALVDPFACGIGDRRADALGSRCQAHRVGLARPPRGALQRRPFIELRIALGIRLPDTIHHRIQLDQMLGTVLLAGEFGEAEQPIILRIPIDGEARRLPVGTRRSERCDLGLQRRRRAVGDVRRNGKRLTDIAANYCAPLDGPSALREPVSRRGRPFTISAEIVLERRRGGVGAACEHDGDQGGRQMPILFFHIVISQ